MKSFLSYLITFVFQAVMINEVYSENAGFFDGIWTTNDLKFVMIIAVTIFISVLMLYYDTGKPKPRIVDILLTVMMALVAVVLTYEWAIYRQWVVIIAMAVAFGVGVFALDIIVAAKSRVPDVVNRLVDKYFKKN
jgi:prepilin signal peptidase PulO-like enzyme (type II secretory pathway)